MKPFITFFGVLILSCSSLIAQTASELDKLEEDIWRAAEHLLAADSLFVTGYTYAGEAYMASSESALQENFLKAAKYFKALMYAGQEGSAICLNIDSDLKAWDRCTHCRNRILEMEKYYRQIWIAARDIYAQYNRFESPSTYTNYMQTHTDLIFGQREVYGDIMSTILVDLDNCFDLGYE
jgi:hypothetical protein